MSSMSGTNGGQGISRRRLLQTSALGGVALLLAGCRSAAASGSSAGSGGAAGGTLTIGSTTDLAPSNLLRTGTNTTTLSLIFDTLAGLDPKTLQPTPGIATSWQWNADKTQLTVNLRDDVYYHSGRKLGPADAIFSIQTEQTKTSGSQIGATALLIESMKVTGANQFTLTLTKPVSSFLNLLILTPLIDQQTFSGLYSGKQIVGTGPFAFQSWTPGSQVNLTRNKRYWQTGLPHADSVAVRVFGSEQALVSAARTGEVDLAWNLVPSDAALLTKDGKLASHTTGVAFAEWYVGVNVKTKPFDNVLVRQAIAYALDRDRIAKQAFAGFGTATCLPWSASLPGLSAGDKNHYGYDPDKAKSLLQQAGVLGATAPILTGAGNEVAAAIQNIVEYNLSQAGFNPKPAQSQATTFQTQLQAASIDGLWINNVGQSYLSAGTVLLGNAPLKVTGNTSNVTDPQYATLADNVIYASSDAQVAAANEALTQYVLDQAWHITVGQAPTVGVTAAGLTGLQTSGTGGVVLTSAQRSS
jgi:peptide/nickel transport system substrate-binding protein